MGLINPRARCPNCGGKIHTDGLGLMTGKQCQWCGTPLTGGVNPLTNQARRVPTPEEIQGRALRDAARATEMAQRDATRAADKKRRETELMARFQAGEKLGWRDTVRFSTFATKEQQQELKERQYDEASASRAKQNEWYKRKLRIGRRASGDPPGDEQAS